MIASRRIAARYLRHVGKGARDNNNDSRWRVLGVGSLRPSEAGRRVLQKRRTPRLPSQYLDPQSH